ncbi:hypothetical protein VNN37_10320 (plasmid) [Lactococcus garvieae]|uniref:hypothetical protein n=1 Tax=Lactococcus garvieae TaxID=1363 RepID=UPI0030CCC51C
MDNITSDDYYYKFYKDIRDVNEIDNNFFGVEEDYLSFEIYDTEEVIAKFKDLCQPRNERSMEKEETCWFYIILFYLSKMGYYIEEFPRLTARPPLEPFKFIYEEIRSKLIDEGKVEEDGRVTYNERRKLVRNLTFAKNDEHKGLDYDIESKFKEISNRNATFQEMSTDEKLAEIINLIEHMLKVNGKYIKLDYSKNCFDYIDDDTIIKYKNKLQCFRHSSPQSISERDSFSEDQKKFMVDYGIIILNGIHISKKN